MSASRDPRERCFESAVLTRPARIAAGAVVCVPILYAAWRIARWALIDAIWVLPPGATPDVCHVASAGACWAVIGERGRFILFGAYPSAEQWRAAVACLLFAGPFVLTLARAAWTPAVAASWIAAQVSAAALLSGGVAGLREIPIDLWGGLPVTLLLSTASFTLALPVAIALALGRRSALPAIRGLSAAWIEAVRGVPLITLLFMASVLAPLCLPPAFVPDKALRTLATYAIVIAAYQAEVVGAGIDGLPFGQREAAAALGLSPARATALIVLPQALRAALPATINTFIGFFKDTTLIMIVGLFDLLGAAHAATGDGRWAGFGVEVYAFVALVYGALCYLISRCGARLERAGAGARA